MTRHTRLFRQRMDTSGSQPKADCAGLMAFAPFPGSRRQASICQVEKYATCASPAMERFGSVPTRVLQAGKTPSLPIIRNSTGTTYPPSRRITRGLCGPRVLDGSTLSGNRVGCARSKRATFNAWEVMAFSDLELARFTRTAEGISGWERQMEYGDGSLLLRSDIHLTRGCWVAQHWSSAGTP